MSLERFKDWQYEDLNDLNKSMEFSQIPEGTKLYSIGDKPEYFYIVLKGALFMETIVDVQRQIRYPIGFHEWQTKTITKTIQYRVKVLDTGDMFGHQEIIYPEARTCKVTAVEDCAILQLPASKFMDFFTKELYKDKQQKEDTKTNTSLKYTFNFWDKINMQQIVDNIKAADLMRQKKANAVLKGLNLNALQMYGREIHKEDRDINKFKYVLKRARSHNCLGTEEIEELNKITVVKTTCKLSN